MNNKKGRVTLIGAGPGDKGLITVKGLEYLKKADVVVYDRLVSHDVLSLSPETAELINVGKVMNHHNIPQPEINKILLNKAMEGKNVVRLKGGDPFVFGRGGEELELLTENNIEFEVIPGITSAISALAYSGIPVTHRDFASSIHFVTGHAKDGLVENIDFKALKETKGTILFYMGVSTLSQLINGLLEAGMDKDTPCAAVENGTRFNMRTLISTLDNMIKDAEKFQLKSPAVIAVGKVCALGDKFAWFSKSKLFSKKVIVPHALNSNNKLCEKLKNYGAEVIDFACMQLKEIEDNKNMADLVQNIHDYKMIIFSSKNSVLYFFKELTRAGKDSRALSGMIIAAFGKTCLQELKKYGINADVSLFEYSIESLAESINNLNINGKKALIYAENDETLRDILKEKCSDIKEVSAYKIEYLPFDYILPLKEYINQGVVTAFTSSAAVNGFVQAADMEDFSSVKAVCIGQMTYDTAKKYNMQAYMSERADIESLIEKIKEMEQ